MLLLLDVRKVQEPSSGFITQIIQKKLSSLCCTSGLAFVVIMLSPTEQATVPVREGPVAFVSFGELGISKRTMAAAMSPSVHPAQAQQLPVQGGLAVLVQCRSRQVHSWCGMPNPMQAIWQEAGARPGGKMWQVLAGIQHGQHVSFWQGMHMPC